MNKILLSALLSIALLSNSFSQITLTPTITDAPCNGLCNGSISVTPIGGLGPFSYTWSNGDTSANISGLCAGSYSVTVVDIQLLSVSQTFTVTEPAAINIALQGIDVQCGNGSNGSIVATVVGGTPVYTYLWSNGSTTQSQTALPIGVYSLTVTDGNGCSVTDTITINSISNLVPNIVSVNPSCGLADGSITINPIGGVPPFQYTLNGDPLQQGTNVATGLAEGNYIIVVTDSTGCVVDKSIDLSQVKLTIDKMIPADCSNKNGEIRMAASGGTAPYTYSWSIGGGNTPNADSLATGGYSVTVTDSAGCSIHKNILVPFASNCIGELSGFVFYDLDGDCTFDSTEAPVQNARISVTGNGNLYVLHTDVDGNYHATLPLATYIIEPFGAQNITCPVSLKYQANLMQSGVLIGGNNFAIQTVPYSDVSVTGTTSIARPGFQSDVWVAVTNHSSVTGVSTGQAQLTLDAKTNAVTASDSGVISGKVVTWNYSLNQGEQKTFHLKTQIIAPPTTNIGDVLVYEVKVIPATADSFSNNNIDTLRRTVQGSYDPNDKAVFPNGNILVKDTVLKYTIRFQNTGNDTAFTVIVRDTLDANLNPYTFRNFSASHPMTPVFVASNVIEFRFDQINLPDSFVNEPASNGFVTFYINRFKNIPVGSTVKNQAAIYFDYNLPIFTNTTVNTVVNPILSIEEFGNAAIKIYPNPVNEKLFIAVEDNQFEGATLFDLNGARVAENTAPELSVSGLPHGMYVCKVALKNAAVYYTKIIVE